MLIWVTTSPAFTANSVGDWAEENDTKKEFGETKNGGETVKVVENFELDDSRANSGRARREERKVLLPLLLLLLLLPRWLRHFDKLSAGAWALSGKPSYHDVHRRRFRLKVTKVVDFAN